MGVFSYISIIVGAVALIVSAYFYWRSRLIQKESARIQQESKQKVYELGILKEISDRVGYSLNIEEIVDVIAGSLKQFLEYTTVSYMLIGSERVRFKSTLNAPASREFVDDVRSRMLLALSALSGREYTVDDVDETLSGALINQDSAEPVRSFFNIPLVINENVVGVLTVADPQSGLYKESEMTILHKIINQASLAVTRLQRVVRTEQGKLNAMIESMNEGVIMTDIDYRVAIINPAAKRALGLEDEEDINLFDLSEHMDVKLDIRSHMEESTRLKRVVTVNEITIGERSYQLFIAPVHGHIDEKKEEEVLGNVIILHDRTHEREVERLRKDFTSMMVHELRSPLDSIKKIGEMMRSDMIRNSRDLYDEYVKMIYKSSSQMLELVNDLLDVAKIESGKFELHLQPTNIKTLLKERIQFFQATAKDAEVKLGAVFGENIPEDIEIDPFRISQVLNNFLSNAVKFTQPGGSVTLQAIRHKKGLDVAEEAFAEHVDWLIDPETVAALSSLSDCLVIAVSDTGPGVSPGNINKLFNKFAQFEAGARSDKKGTGLGLVISKGIIQAHKGIIGLGSKKDVGTTFYFTLTL